jgi:Zn-finger nucleic acid-binding protein
MVGSNSVPCPACQTVLQLKDLESLTIWACLNCGGIWLGRHQFQAIMRTGTETLQMLLDLTDTPVQCAITDSMACPDCEIKLHRIRLPGSDDVWSSTCYECGGSYVPRESLANLSEHMKKGDITPHHLSRQVRAIVTNIDVRKAVGR